MGLVTLTTDLGENGHHGDALGHRVLVANAGSAVGRRDELKIGVNRLLKKSKNLRINIVSRNILSYIEIFRQKNQTKNFRKKNI